jgi:hypothetical protein
MRTAAIAATTIIALGAFLAIAAGTAMGPSFIGIGMLVIATAGAVAMTVSSGTGPAVPRPSGG